MLNKVNWQLFGAHRSLLKVDFFLKLQIQAYHNRSIFLNLQNSTPFKSTIIWRAITDFCIIVLVVEELLRILKADLKLIIIVIVMVTKLLCSLFIMFRITSSKNHTC